MNKPFESGSICDGVSTLLRDCVITTHFTPGGKQTRGLLFGDRNNKTEHVIAVIIQSDQDSLEADGF